MYSAALFYIKLVLMQSLADQTTKQNIEPVCKECNVNLFTHLS